MGRVNPRAPQPPHLAPPGPLTSWEEAIDRLIMEKPLWKHDPRCAMTQVLGMASEDPTQEPNVRSSRASFRRTGSFRNSPQSPRTARVRTAAAQHPSGAHTARSSSRRRTTFGTVHRDRDQLPDPVSVLTKCRNNPPQLGPRRVPAQPTPTTPPRSSRQHAPAPPTSPRSRLHRNISSSYSSSSLPKRPSVRRKEGPTPAGSCHSPLARTTLSSVQQTRPARTHSAGPRAASRFEIEQASPTRMELQMQRGLEAQSTGVFIPVLNTVVRKQPLERHGSKPVQYTVCHRCGQTRSGNKREPCDHLFLQTEALTFQQNLDALCSHSQAEYDRRQQRPARSRQLKVARTLLVSNKSKVATIDEVARTLLVSKKSKVATSDDSQEWEKRWKSIS